MRFLLTSLVVLVLSVLLGGVLMQDTGFVVIGIHGQVLRTSLAFFAVVLLLTVVVLYVVIRVGRKIWRAPRDLHVWNARRRQSKALTSLSKGFLALAQGDWKTAEKTLTNGATRSDQPLVYYLGAARAAQALHEGERRDKYLQLARSQGQEAEVAVLLAEAEVQWQAGELDAMRKTLDRLQNTSVERERVQRLELSYHRSCRQWPQVLETLNELAKTGALNGAEQTRLETEAVAAMLQPGGIYAKPDVMLRVWEQLPKQRRKQPQLIAIYCRALMHGGQHDTAEGLVRGALKKGWHADLTRLYGEIKSSDGLDQIKFLEDRLPEHVGDPVLLLAIGRLCARQGLWGKARSYLEDLIEKHPTPDAYRLLAEAQEQLGDREAALRSHRKGLMLATSPEAKLPQLPPARPA